MKGKIIQTTLFLRKSYGEISLNLSSFNILPTLFIQYSPNLLLFHTLYTRLAILLRGMFFVPSCVR